jgi:signal peptidase II
MQTTRGTPLSDSTGGGGAGDAAAGAAGAARDAAAGAGPGDETAEDAADASGGGKPANNRIRLFAVVAACVFLIDLSTKVVAVSRLSVNRPVSLLDGLLTLRLTRNPGAAFSFGTGYTVVLSVLAIAVAVAVVRLSSRLGSAGWAVALGLLLGGACGNLTDRLFRDPGPFRGRVVDFVELPNWPIFNAADSAIVLGACLIVLQSVRGVHLDGSHS